MNKCHLLKEILLKMPIPEVFKRVLSSRPKLCDMKHVIVIVDMLDNSLQKRLIKEICSENEQEELKTRSTTALSSTYDMVGSVHKSTFFMSKNEADWQRREWDVTTLLTFCQLPIRRLITDATRSGVFDIQDITTFLGEQSLANVQTVDLVEALLATVPIEVLCSELCRLHERLDNPPVLDSIASVGMLHYVSAMIASRHTWQACRRCSHHPYNFGKLSHVIHAWKPLLHSYKRSSCCILDCIKQCGTTPCLMLPEAGGLAINC